MAFLEEDAEAVDPEAPLPPSFVPEPGLPWDQGGSAWEPPRQDDFAALAEELLGGGSPAPWDPGGGMAPDTSMYPDASAPWDPSQTALNAPATVPGLPFEGSDAAWEPPRYGPPPTPWASPDADLRDTPAPPPSALPDWMPPPSPLLALGPIGALLSVLGQARDRHWEGRYPADATPLGTNPYDMPPAFDEQGNVTADYYPLAAGGMAGALDLGGNLPGMGNANALPPGLAAAFPHPTTLTPHSGFDTGIGAPREAPTGPMDPNLGPIPPITPGSPNYRDQLSARVAWARRNVGIPDPMAGERGQPFGGLVHGEIVPPTLLPGTRRLYRVDSDPIQAARHWSGETYTGQIPNQPPVVDRTEFPAAFAGRWASDTPSGLDMYAPRGSRALYVDIPEAGIGPREFKPPIPRAADSEFHDSLGHTEFILPPEYLRRLRPTSSRAIQVAEQPNDLRRQTEWERIQHALADRNIRAVADPFGFFELRPRYILR